MFWNILGRPSSQSWGQQAGLWGLGRPWDAEGFVRVLRVTVEPCPERETFPTTSFSRKDTWLALCGMGLPAWRSSCPTHPPHYECACVCVCVYLCIDV